MPSASPSQTPSATPEAAAGAEDTSPESSSAPGWVWWVLVLLLVVGVASIPLVLRARRRRDWHAQLSASQTDVGWFARVLIPQVRDAGSVEAAAGAWKVGGEARVTEVEDRLTALESSAPDEPSRGQALALRDAVRAGRARVGAVVTTSTEDTLPLELDEVVAQLEAALSPAQSAAAPSPSTGEGRTQPPS